MLYCILFVLRLNNPCNGGWLNNDSTVKSKAYAWRPLALLPILEG